MKSLAALFLQNRPQEAKDEAAKALYEWAQSGPKDIPENLFNRISHDLAYRKLNLLDPSVYDQLYQPIFNWPASGDVALVRNVLLKVLLMEWRSQFDERKLNQACEQYLAELAALIEKRIRERHSLYYQYFYKEEQKVLVVDDYAKTKEHVRLKGLDILLHAEFLAELLITPEFLYKEFREDRILTKAIDRFCAVKRLQYTLETPEPAAENLQTFYKQLESCRGRFESDTGARPFFKTVGIVFKKQEENLKQHKDALRYSELAGVLVVPFIAIVVGAALGFILFGPLGAFAGVGIGGLCGVILSQGVFFAKDKIEKYVNKKAELNRVIKGTDRALIQRLGYHPPPPANANSEEMQPEPEVEPSVEPQEPMFEEGKVVVRFL